MKGLMMDYPLTLTQFFERSRRLFAKKTLATRIPSQPLFRYTYAEFAERVRRLAGGLRALDIRPGDRVGTFMWNCHQHLEAYWAIPMMGAVLHTVNFRLAPPDIAYIVTHGGDTILIVGASVWPLLEPMRRELTTVREIVIVRDTADARLPVGGLEYEDLLRRGAPVAEWPQLDERDAAAMCYTSGTTGHPKGVVYSHRALYLHSLGMAQADSFALSERDVILHIVPMFHANAWCVPFAGVMVGATQIFGGPSPQPRDIVEMTEQERVTVVGAVPTVWIGVKEICEREGHDISSIRLIPCGGSAAPRSLIELFDEKFGVPMLHAWGMTETTPVGTLSRLKSYMEPWPDDQKYTVRAKQGFPSVCVDLRIVDEQGRVAPWDGKTMGEIQVRGPWVTSGYYKADSTDHFTEDGWFKTGDVGTIDPEGYIQITDRTKDVIKSGGEWISSVDLENLIMAHPKVLEAAVVAVPHPKWIERPLACVVPKPEHHGSLTAGEIIEFLRPQVARFWLPDDVVLIEAVPKTSVGKFDKKVLRERFKGWPPKAG
ncbi:MAG: long-chain fatty acid--CoA ligase [Candidatus Rokuibacteriota bacterium]|nr:MAG: long-chain fatty acid--CoA ligase [Candidatus Rokubacteria bacterium]